MPTVSSSLLYHYTNKKGLWGILKDGFKPSYCRERILTNPDASFDFAIPMACFCDIPETLAGAHSNTYGNYAIGLSDRWRINNRLNPMLYLSEDSDVFNQITKLGEIIVQIKNAHEDKIIKPHTGKTIVAADTYQDPEVVSQLKQLFVSLLIRVKPYIGPKYDKTGKLECLEYKYYDEREYRYIYERLPVYGLDKNSSRIPDNIKKETELEPFLCFQLYDIGQIIVNEPSEVKDVEYLINNSEIIGGCQKPSVKMPIINTWHDII